MREFERDTALKAEMQRIIKARSIQSVIETGTEYGGTANAFARMVPHVCTVDIEKKWDDGDLLENVQFFLGRSSLWLAHCMGIVVGRSLEPILFFLDAHTSIDTDACPLREELGIIGKNAKYISPPVIVVHDCLVPGSTFGFDTYRGVPLSLEYIRDLLPDVFPKGFTTRYNEIANGAQRGVLFVEPS